MIKGERIFLRPLAEADVTERYLGWLHDPEVTRYLTLVRHNPPADLQELRDYLASRPGRLFLAIILREGNRHIGNIKLGYDGDVGILIGEKGGQGSGYGSEAIRLLTEYALCNLGLTRLWAGCHVQNVGSKLAFIKAGWVEVERDSERVLLEAVTQT